MKKICMLAGALVAFGAASVSADVLYDNFGANDTYNTGSGATISDGPPINTDWDQGFFFTVSGGDYFLDTLEFAMGFVTGTNSADITLYDDAGGVPGNALETVTVMNFGQFGNNNPLSVAAFSGSTVLQNGQTYYLVASSPNPSWLAWNVNTTGALGRVSRSNMGAWSVNTASTAVAARVNGSLVPAPGALALLGLAGVVSRRRRRA